MEYEKRIVCFMDLLGFKKMISDSMEHLNIRNRIFNLLNDINEIHNYFHDSRIFTIVPENEIKDGFIPKETTNSGLQSEMSFFRIASFFRIN